MKLNRTMRWFLFLCLMIETGAAQNYLSNLAATKDDPLYTTYAAPLTRSEFILDEGYQFIWYDPGQGINFITDKAGNLCLGFKLNGDFRYFLNSMYSEPVVTASYSDLVRYYYYPFEHIRVDVFFDVYSSRVAIQDVTITNEGAAAANLSVYPFLHHATDIMDDVSLIPEHDGFTFHHRESPDGWTTSHGVPYAENIFNVYVMDSTADAYGAYSDISSGSVPNAGQTSPPLANYCVEWGLVNHSDGSLCYHTPPQAQQIILHNGSAAEILTEDAPKWGDPDPNIPGNGYQGCELGNFRNSPIANGDSFMVIFTDLATVEQGKSGGIIPALPASGGVNANVQLTNEPFPTTPQNVSASFSQYGSSSVITWDGASGYLYSVYRRTHSTPGRYDLIAANLNSSAYLDTGLNPDSSYAYTVIARDSAGRFSGHSWEVGNIGGGVFFEDVQNNLLSNAIPSGDAKVVAMQRNFIIEPGSAAHLRMIRGVTENDSNLTGLLAECRDLHSADLGQFQQEDEQIYSRIPRLSITNPDEEMMYWNAFSLVRQCMLPPEGESSYNYYVFSREPQWGWGHGGQVFHESLTMLAYVFMDPQSAMNSQRVYMERQWSDGYINYRTGPYLNETIPYNNQFTTSAPWFSWENREIYRVAPDTAFLQEAYQSGQDFYNYWLVNRDADNDGLCEWGAHAVLECVRDGQVAVWDQVGWPSNFECLDLNVMLVNEARSLAEMAQEVGNSAGYQQWTLEAEARTDSINKYMWDPQTGFYYQVDMADHDFSFNSPNDLKRKEIIGFLPLWAGVASPQQAAQLLQHLTNPDEFWRNYGVPTLAADDSYYNPMGYWNGPVWVQWQYLIFRGLLRYGYVNEARQLAGKVLDNVIHQLKANHWFWELYSPDDFRAGWNKAYIWSTLVARMIIDLHNPSLGIPRERKTPEITQFELEQNYPNPFNSQTNIQFSLPAAAPVQLFIYDLLGQQVRTLLDEEMPAGNHRIRWDGKDAFGVPVASGLYFYWLTTPRHHVVKKMLYVR